MKKLIAALLLLVASFSAGATMDTAYEVNPKSYGAVGNGIADDIRAIEAATTYAIATKKSIKFPSGVFRISRQWVLGWKFLNEVDMMRRDFTNAPSFNAVAYSNARFGQHINIEGSGKTIIYGDFEGTNAVIYYGIIGGGSSLNRLIQHNWHSISGLTIVSKNNYVKGNFVDCPNTQQTGLCLPRTPGVILNGVSFFGMKFGLLTQDVYGSNISNIKANNCEYGSFLVGHNANVLTNIVNDNCRNGMYLSGAATSINNIWCNNCETGLQIGGKTLVAGDLGAGNILINVAYFENDLKSNKNVAQLIIGDETESKDNEVTGITIKNMAGATQNRMFMKIGNARDISMENCSIFYEPVKTSFSKTRISVTNAIRPMKVTGNGRVKYLN